jgi:hypothetical protein
MPRINHCFIPIAASLGNLHYYSNEYDCNNNNCKGVKEYNQWHYCDGRKVVWKHLLDVYPAGLPGKERLEYMKAKTAEYHSLRQRWQHHVKNSEQVIHTLI